jgi:hypothetical protein
MFAATELRWENRPLCTKNCQHFTGSFQAKKTPSLNYNFMSVSTLNLDVIVVTLPAI